MEYQEMWTELKHTWNVEAKTNFIIRKILHALCMFRQGYIIVPDVVRIIA
jgi:hypothetical protein